MLLDLLIEQAEKLAGDAANLASDLRTYKAIQEQSGTPNLNIKLKNGRLTEHGLDQINLAFAAGLKDRAIASAFDISMPAVRYRRLAWAAQIAQSETIETPQNTEGNTQ